MPQEPTAPEIVSALSRAGYFDAAGFDPALFIRVVERRLNLGVDRALSVLAAGDLTTFEHTPDPGVHPKDKLDLWRVKLTAAGRAFLSSQQDRLVGGQTSNTSLERTRER